MNSDDRESNRPESIVDESIRDEVHSGHDLESGLLARVREWTDAAPWLRLGRTLRVAASPTLVLLTSGVLLVWWFGAITFFGEEFLGSLRSIHTDDLSWWRLFFLSVWSLLVWLRRRCCWRDKAAC